jgi:chromate transporter
VFTTATFIGYLLAGGTGAFLATLGIFLPSFFLVAGLGPAVARLRRSGRAGAFLDGVNAGALALMAAVTWTLARAALVDRRTLLLGAACAVLLVRAKLNPTWIILGGAAAGLLLKTLA